MGPPDDIRPWEFASLAALPRLWGDRLSDPWLRKHVGVCLPTDVGVLVNHKYIHVGKLVHCMLGCEKLSIMPVFTGITSQSKIESLPKFNFDFPPVLRHWVVQHRVV